MDELEIGGKKYFSSRKAAREHKYHIDYIGQLIRAGKVQGKKVGRSWYVEEESLRAYLLQEAGTPQAQAPAQVKEEVNEVEEVAAPVVEEIKEPEPVVVAEPVVVPEPVVTPAPAVEKVYESSERVVRLHMPEKVAPKPSTLTYIEDSEPMLPVLEGRMRTNADFVAIPLRKSSEREEENETVPLYETPVVTVEKRSRAALSLPRVQTIAAVGFLTLAVAAAASSLLTTSIKVTEGQPASVVFGIK